MPLGKKVLSVFQKSPWNGKLTGITMLLAYFAYFLVCYLIALCGKNRKFGFWGYFFAAVLFTPLLGVLLILASDKRPVIKP